MIFQANIKDISSTVKDFEVLCSYIAENKPLLTAKGDLGTKACFELNTHMAYPESGAKKTDWMSKYSSISLYFLTAMSCGLLEPYPVKGQKFAVTISDAYMEFQKMNDFTKYLTLFLAWMRYADCEELYPNDISKAMGDAAIIDLAFERIRRLDKPALIERNEKYSIFMLDYDALQILMNHCPIITRSLRDFGIISFSQEDAVKIDTYNHFIKQLYVTGLGIALSSACAARRFTWVNVLEATSIHLADDDDKAIKLYENDYERNLPGSAGFFKPFLSCFPENAIDTNAISRLLFPHTREVQGNTVYEFKVQLWRDCYRVIQCRDNHTFDGFHLAIQKAFSFDNDHLYSFFMDGKKWSRRRINSTDVQEPPYANELCIGKAGLRVKQTFLYLFDFGDQWAFHITLLSITENNTVPLHPQIVKSVGESPEQYPKFYEE